MDFSPPFNGDVQTSKDWSFWFQTPIVFTIKSGSLIPVSEVDNELYLSMNVTASKSQGFKAPHYLLMRIP